MGNGGDCYVEVLLPGEVQDTVRLMLGLGDDDAMGRTRVTESAGYATVG